MRVFGSLTADFYTALFQKVDEHPNQLGIKLFSGFLIQDRNSRLHTYGRLVRPDRRHSIKGIGNTQNTAQNRDLITGQLTEKIRRRPYSVVLFDEIEKAHPDVLNILLQVLDDGRITDAQGRVVNFENTVIVMTSNAGSEGGVAALGFGRTAGDQVKEKTMKALRSFLRPEFINRVDEIITFNHLTEENFVGIADIMLAELKDSLSTRGLTLSWSEEVRQYLVKKAYSVTYGARNLRRTIQRELEDPISEAIIDSFENPITAIEIAIVDDQVKLNVQ